jgi:hypothetical protein
MRKKLSNFAVLLSMAILFLSFTNIKSPRFKLPKTCYNYVSVYAQGLTVNHVTILANGLQIVSTQTSITSGTHQDFLNGSFVQGATITVEVNILGQGAAPRMNSLGIDNPYQCISYNFVTQGSITGVKQCATMLVSANNATDCP